MQGVGGPVAYSPGMGVLLLLVPLGIVLLIVAATRSVWALGVFIALVVAVMAFMIYADAATRGWDGL